MILKYCKICKQEERGSLHILETELDRICTAKSRFENNREFDAAAYWAKREDVIRNELFQRLDSLKIGYHEFEAEDNLDAIERLAEEKGLV